MQEKTASVWNRLLGMIDDKRGPEQMEKGLRKEDRSPDPNYTHLPLEVLLPDILNSSGLGGEEVPRTQSKNANLTAEQRGHVRRTGGSYCLTKTPGTER